MQSINARRVAAFVTFGWRSSGHVPAKNFYRQRGNSFRTAGNFSMTRKTLTGYSQFVETATVPQLLFPVDLVLQHTHLLADRD